MLLIAGFGYIMFVRYRERLALHPQTDDVTDAEADRPASGDRTPLPAATAEAMRQQELDPPMPA